MYNIKILNFEKKYLIDELIKIILRPDQYEIVEDYADMPDCIVFNESGSDNQDVIKKEVFNKLSDLTGETPKWGILTGVRPVKLCGEYYQKSRNREDTIKYLREKYYISKEKSEFITDMYIHQIECTGNASNDSCGVYIGIPFCPTRCLYCSFASNQVECKEYDRYLDALVKEIRYCGTKLKQSGIITETIYIGGGTPTSLSADQLDLLLKTVIESFDFSRLQEFTIEAGRPDTITAEKLKVIKKYNITRISINPQTMKDSTLELIGRNHTTEDIISAYEMAREEGFDNINMDLIAGLPGESVEDFQSTLDQIISMNPESVTVHCLAVKRASKLIDIDKNYHYKQAGLTDKMLSYAQEKLTENEYIPSYLYRQKHMAGALENTGYCKAGKDCIYNIRIMDEHQMIVALGAGGISKAYFPDENRFERVPNVTNYQEYINRIDEMIQRKELNLFNQEV